MIKSKVTILFAGDSGDGIQLLGSHFTENTALFGNNLSTFPNFPAEIRAPQGTLAGVSGFQIQFGSEAIDTPGDKADVLVVMNVAALKANLGKLKKNGIVLINEDGFDNKNLRLAKIEINPLEDNTLEHYKSYKIPVGKLVKEALKETTLTTKAIDKTKNMFFLGFIYWMYHRSIENSILAIEQKFKHDETVKTANISILKAGYFYGETTEVILQTDVYKAVMPKGTYRNISGNKATSLGLVTASEKSNLKLFYGSYPITPASDILHELSKLKNFNVLTFQAEDEIAAISAALGASYGGALGVTASSGPGIALKMEAIGLAVMFEIPLVIINVQRGGPSTGLPTKTEQADLLQAMNGRNGEAPLIIVAPSSPTDCFDMVFEACKLSIENMTPVMFLSDGFIANGSEPWLIPNLAEIPIIYPNFVTANQENFQPYNRDKNLVRNWAIPGTKGLEHRIGGIEKEDITGNISYEPENHQKMVKIRAQKVSNIQYKLPELKIEQGKNNGSILVLGWGSTYGSIKTAVRNLIVQNCSVSQLHLKYLNPFQKELQNIINQFDIILVPELNDGQLIQLLRNQYNGNFVALNKIKGMPFEIEEIEQFLLKILKKEVVS